jgi:LysR family transcriptional regulator, low CO2-responsive transcriptional regulator
MLKSEHLEAFVAFAEHLNFTHAAHALHLSQPALHVQIKKLGEEVGVPLYRRRGQKLELTVAGQRLLLHAREEQQRGREILDELRTGSPHPTVTLAAGTGSYLYLLGPAIREFMRTSPARLRLLQRDRAGTALALRQGEAHLGVGAFDALPDDLDAQLLLRVPPLLVMPRRHPLAKKRRVRLEDLQDAPLIVPPVGQPLRATLAQALSSLGIRWQVAVEATGWSLVLRFVELGMGLTVVNGCCEIPRTLAARPLPELPHVSYYVVTPRGAQLGAETKRLRALLVARH